MPRARLKERDDMEMQALAYIEEMANIDRGMRSCSETIEMLWASLEQVSAIDYERDGSRASYDDKRPALLDRLDNERMKAEGLMNRAEERAIAERLFQSNEAALICWLKYGERLTWHQVAHEMYYSRKTVMHKEYEGLLYIWKNMPREYRQRKG